MRLFNQWAVSALLFTLVLGSLANQTYASIITVEAEDLSQVSRSGLWGVFSGSVLQGGQGLESFNIGSSLSWSFESISLGGLSIFGTTGPNRGIFELAIDGVVVSTQNTFSSSFLFQQELFAVSGLVAGTHNATLTVNSQIIAVDFFEYDGVASIPIPATVWLVGSGLLGLIGIKKRRKA